MADFSKIEAINGGFPLPESTIQRIQSFLSAKEAAQTSVLSKSWYKSWLTRPNLDFDVHDLNKDNSYDSISSEKLLKLAKKTIKRYKKSDLKIDSFRLRIKSDEDLIADLIVKALKLGATRLSLKLLYGYDLPHEVFGCENLVSLSIKGCKIDLGMYPKVRCSRLKSFSLKNVIIQGNDVIANIVSSCPLIGELTFSNVHIESSRRRVVSVGVGDTHGKISLHKLSRLRCLVFSSVKIDPLIFEDFSSKFPLLKDLTLDECNVKEDVSISSSSLERVNVTQAHRRHRHDDMGPKRLRVKFELPNIQKVTFEGSFIPSMTFKSTLREWESDVSITRNRLSTLWFRKLNRFISALSRSKISLSIHIFSGISFDYEVRHVLGLYKHEVENLTIEMGYLPSLSRYAFFDGLFRVCRPRFIIQEWLPKTGNRWKTNNDFLCRTLVQGMHDKILIPSHFMYGLHDLEEVSVEIFVKRVAEWRSVPLESLLDASTCPKDKQKLRFQMKWSS